MIFYYSIIFRSMSEHENWIEGKYKVDEFFRFSRQFRSLDHAYMLIAVAPNGGPIAITFDKTQLVAVSLSDPTLENVCIFDNEGSITHKVLIENWKKEAIVGFDFISDERLLVVFAKAYYWIVDTNTGSYVKTDLKGILKDGENILQAKVCGKGFGFLTSVFKFKLIQNVDEVMVKEFYENQMEVVPSYWTIYRPREIISNSIEINFPHPKAGIIQIFENRRRKEDLRRRVIYNRELEKETGPDIPYITYISQISPNGRSIVFFCAVPVYKPLPPQPKGKKNDPPPLPPLPDSYNYKLIITLADGTSPSHKSFELKKLNDSFLNEKRSPKKILWCGDQSLVIQYHNNQLYLMFLSDFQMIKIEKDREAGQQFTFIRQEVDGVRLITKVQNKILRKIPNSYRNIFGLLSQKPSATLYQTYEAFKARQPFQDDDIKKNKKQLSQAVLDVVDAARFEIQQDTCTTLLKSGSYGKSFLSPLQVPNDLILETCKQIRILNQIKNSLKRVMTFAQFVALTEEDLLNILLRYNLHYLAFQIFRFLNKSLTFRIQIYTHWAICKLKSTDSDNQIVSDIKRQLENQKGVSFTEIAHKAIECGKMKLALQLLQEEPSLAKKVPLLLWMGTQSNDSLNYYTKAVQDARESQDPDLLCLAIQEIRTSKNISQLEFFKLFSASIQGRCALISYYRIFDKSVLIKYYDQTKQHQNLGLFSLSEAYKSLRYEDHIKFMEAARAKFNMEPKNPLNEWRNESLAQYISLYQLYLKNFPKVEFKGEGAGKRGIKPGPITEIIDILIAKDNVTDVDNVKGLYKVSDKTIVLSTIKSYINQRRYQELERILDKFQKKMKLPVEMFADMIFQKKQDAWALRILSRIPEKDKKEEYSLLQRIGKIKQAVDAATRRKDLQSLLQMRASIEDSNLLGYLNDQISTLPPKK